MCFVAVRASLVIGWALSAVAVAAPSPIRVVDNWSTLTATLTDAPVIYQKEDLAILRTPEASETDFRNLYVVNMAQRLTPPAGEVLYFLPARLAVMRLDTDQAAQISAALHAEGLACGVLFKLNGDRVAVRDAATPVPLLPTDVQDARVAAVVAQIKTEALRATIEELAAVPTRFHDSDTGIGIAAILAEKYQALRGSHSEVTITRYDHGDATSQNSLVVRIEGTTKAQEVIVLGSHLDSVNWADGTDQRAPGADDNASGTATNLEIFRVLMASGIRLQRTLEIHAYAAEEVGLVGSQDLVEAYQRQGTQVVAMLQHDMDLYTPEGESDKIWLVSNNTDAGLNDHLSHLIDLYAGVPWGKETLSGGSSDHESWHRAGYAVAFPFEHPSHYNHQIHSANDTVVNSGAFGLATAFTRLGAAYVLHFAGIQPPSA